jgi:signal transduction histidine kinase/ActR/RegA family two-component response regulator
LDFSQQYLQATLIVSLLSVWVLVGLFAYLNRYTKREYFTVWTAGWLFYALWLTLSLTVQNVAPNHFLSILKQWCVAFSAVFLLWGSLRFLSIPVRQTLFGLFMLFLMVWTFVSPEILTSVVEIQLPVFILIGLGSLFAGVSFYRLRKKMPFVGAGMLSLGFLLWGLYLVSYPFTQPYGNLYSAGFLVAAVLQLFIAVSMIVLVLEEVRYRAEQVLAEIATVQSEKEALQAKVLTTEEQCRNLYDQVRLTEGVQTAYEELRRTQQVVVQQERLRALGQMASGVAHDVNNALSPIMAYSDLLLNMLPDLPEQTARQYLDTINRSGDDIAHIVGRMREFYRRRSDTEQLVKVNLNQIIEEVIDLTRPRWRDVSQREGIPIQIQREFEPRLPLLLSEPSDLREALINLIFNSVDALPHGGTITLATCLLERPSADADGTLDRQIQVEVRDNGVGMDERTRQRCLEPFFSTKAQRGGTGLGLAMVYGMMQRHDGTIEIDSAPGRGTSVRLTFPVREKVLPKAAPLASADKRPRSLNILCIDDEQQIRQVLNDCLRHWNHRIELASSGKEGLELFRAARRENKPYEAVITDLGMPDIDGHQVARTIKEESPRTPVIMMTGWGTMMKEDGESTPEVDALIGKPPRMRELNELLLRLTAGNRDRVSQNAADSSK